MFKELLHAKRKYYGKAGWYPEAVKMTKDTFVELDGEAKVLKIGINEGYNSRFGSVNGMKIFIDNSQKELFVFGFHYQGEFGEQPF